MTLMTLLAFTIGLLIALLGAVGMFSPARLIELVRRFQSPTGIWVAAGIRLVLGVALYVAAPASRAPEAIRALGVFVFVAGLITPLFGVERFRRILDWWAGLGPLVHRVWGLAAFAFGALLAYAVAP